MHWQKQALQYYRVCAAIKMVFQVKIFAILLVLIVFCDFSAVFGEPKNSEHSLNRNFAEISLKRTKRAAKCSNNFGCNKGRCYADCIGIEGWCYTTNEYEIYNRKYVRCTDDKECKRWWRCAGPCLDCSTE